MTGDKSTNGWTAWEKHVLAELEDLKLSYRRLTDEIHGARMEIERLKVKAGIWGLIGGSVPVVIGMGVYLIQRGI